MIFVVNTEMIRDPPSCYLSEEMCVCLYIFEDFVSLLGPKVNFKDAALCLLGSMLFWLLPQYSLLALSCFLAATIHARNNAKVATLHLPNESKIENHSPIFLASCCFLSCHIFLPFFLLFSCFDISATG